MKLTITLVGSRYFGATVFDTFHKEGFDIARVVAPAADDRLAIAAQKAGIPVHVLANPKIVPGEAIAEGTDLIVAAHTHARVSDEALARSKLRGIGYHPSLLPRHRGIAAVEWTILENDPIAGGSVYHLADGWDAGAVAAQDWCFVGKGETARELWERALAPMGLRLLAEVVRHAREHGAVPAFKQDERFATRAPMIRRTVSLSEEKHPMVTSLVVTVVGPDRPGIVSLLSAKAQGFGANWAGSRMASLAGQFAGMVHFEVPPEHADALTAALLALASTDLQDPHRAQRRHAAARGPAHRAPRAGRPRPPRDRARSLGALAQRGVSIEELHTEIVSGAMTAEHLFKVKAVLLVPKSVSNDDVRHALEALANEMMVDIALGEQAA